MIQIRAHKEQMITFTVALIGVVGYLLYECIKNDLFDMIPIVFIVSLILVNIIITVLKTITLGPEGCTVGMLLCSRHVTYINPEGGMLICMLHSFARFQFPALF